jgi:hypothetical protein
VLIGWEDQVYLLQLEELMVVKVIFGLKGARLIGVQIRGKLQIIYSGIIRMLPLAIRC